ncbi:uncharacterized protein N7511_009018 [Penicillium nucicola]|uniref:uncharacterized protein n=1 Tax=Penicillium nucicola TaxID=1850975 RepID=UPI002545573D|nr:uncharacterized protein N7511_009018 [Penicillium nucicola]KAJ5747322.1 hypothetical protein N7511_009018 [Penicillium nucicola]
MNRKEDARDTIYLEHPCGSSATISRLGATVLSLKTASNNEVLWLDSDRSQAASDGNRLYGGIPVIFPTFGNVEDSRIMAIGDQQDMIRHMESVPHHGFAKDCVWDLITPDDTKSYYDLLNTEEQKAKIYQDGLPQALLRLSPLNVPADLGGSWLKESGDWDILYRIMLKEDELSLDLCVRNQNTREDFHNDMRAKILFHNYLSVSNPGSMNIYGLNDARIMLDSNSARPVYTDNAVSFNIPGFIDQVWTLKQIDTVNVLVKNKVKGLIPQFSITAYNLPDLGEWNHHVSPGPSTGSA